MATPGRLIDLIDRKVADLADVGLVVLDEADRMADMGFMPQVEWVLRHIEGGHQTLLFSATLDGAIQGLVDRYQHDPVFHEVGSPTQTVDKMAHRFLLVHEMDKHRVAAAISRSGSRCLVFTNTKRAADRLGPPARGRRRRRQGHPRRPAPGGPRAGAQALLRRASWRCWWRPTWRPAGSTSTSSTSSSRPTRRPIPKTYLHRAGRTARAGAAGLAVTLVLWNEELEVRRLKRRLGLDEPIVEMFSNDERLADLTSWNPAAEGAA